ncbi:MAG: bifunctional riboflavin kinase/FAD synthetase [Ruminococcus sp.]|nr:bifunctional riboflavin kinase/FAD synthetase [Ruminococcus sp.]
MQIIQETTEFRLPGKSAVAMGKFDGIHLGHQKLLERITEQKKRGLLAAVFTFSPSPEAFFTGKEVKSLMSVDEKRAAFEKAGVDVLIEFPMNKKTAATEPQRFVEEYLTGKMQAAFIAAGTDVSFGREGAGDAGLLQRMAKDFGYHVEIIDKVRIDKEDVSSTLVREALVSGDMPKVNILLGAPYRIEGVVSHGRAFGRTLGMPTVNLPPSGEKLLPPNGVYYSCAWLEDKRYPAISNIGYKPTVSNEQALGVETYLYDFAQDIYGSKIAVELLDFKRPEMKFESVEALKAQMQRDIEEGAVFHQWRFPEKKN